jgi:hypothetical protein
MGLSDGHRFTTKREADLTECRLEPLGPAPPWRGQSTRLFAKRLTWAGRAHTEAAPYLKREPNPSPSYGQSVECATSAAMDLTGELPTAWAGHLSSGEADNEGETRSPRITCSSSTVGTGGSNAARLISASSDTEERLGPRRLRAILPEALLIHSF